MLCTLEARSTGNFSCKTLRTQTLLVRPRPIWDDIQMDSTAMDLEKLGCELHPPRCAVPL
jgi:hypothetical protein